MSNPLSIAGICFARAYLSFISTSFMLSSPALVPIFQLIIVRSPLQSLGALRFEVVLVAACVALQQIGRRPLGFGFCVLCDAHHPRRALHGLIAAQHSTTVRRVL